MWPGGSGGCPARKPADDELDLPPSFGMELPSSPEAIAIGGLIAGNGVR